MKLHQLTNCTKTILLCLNLSKAGQHRQISIAKCLGRSLDPVLEQNKSAPVADATAHFEFHGDWPVAEKQSFLKDMRLHTNFVSHEEENKLIEEIEPYMKRLHYEDAHWDDAIHGFRETERKQWYPHNRAVLERVRQIAFDGEIMPYVHILDLAAAGVIKPHVDSTRYCGNTIAGISLLSDSVMRLVRVDERKYQQGQPVEAPAGASENNTAASVAQNAAEPNDAYRNQPVTTLENNFYVDVLLRRRSMYIMSHTSRYNFSHEILANDVSSFRGQHIKKDRRISIICRNEP
ncbi:alpha-ketoglutarate-dependent dioxygenase alkB homolog 7, mitochondrial [Ceratitis capitata]|uniref:alpha-ketoglutarate-dependent dioxygenase alkB homolog 7, mitochondrial n=1 Tax=Ceratitis capitata TaxID=7213 RepID=UPI000329F3BB|nr:alpha-ketoglutarate-dependent dioxygenase alkB homolog 7, mitochondrial [Ceratitis capitata]